MSKKKPLSDDLRAECSAANALFLSKKNELGLSKKKIADELGISPPGLAQYLNGTNALNAKFASVFSRLIKEPVESFSPRLAKEIVAIAKGISTEKTDGQQAQSIRERSAIAAALASPRSREILESITQAAEDGLLTNEDVELLEMMVQRIMARTSVPTTADPLDGSNTRLRNRLKNAPPDPDTQR